MQDRLASRDPSPPALTARFRARGVRLSGIGAGVELPLTFGDTLAEQRSTRSAIGLFDFSFMGCFELRGPQAEALLERLQTRDLGGLSPGCIAYTLLLCEDGTVWIDATVWRLGVTRFWLMTGRRSVFDAVRAAAGGTEVELEDLSGRYSVLAIQGPESATLLRSCGAEVLPTYFRFGEASMLGHRCTVARLGYTGELGYEILIGAERALGVWDGLMEAGHSWGIAECGFEAADALRIEAGFILFSRELSVPVTPHEIGYGHLLSFRRRFAGARALPAARLREGARALVGLMPVERSAAAAGQIDTLQAQAPAPGQALATSMCYSALFGRTIGMGYVHAADRYPGTCVRLQSGASAYVARLPYYDPTRRLPRSPA